MSETDLGVCLSRRHKVHTASRSRIPLGADRCGTPSLAIAASSHAAALGKASSYEINDAQFHLTNDVREQTRTRSGGLWAAAKKNP